MGNVKPTSAQNRDRARKVKKTANYAEREFPHTGNIDSDRKKKNFSRANKYAGLGVRKIRAAVLVREAGDASPELSATHQMKLTP